MRARLIVVAVMVMPSPVMLLVFTVPEASTLLPVIVVAVTLPAEILPVTSNTPVVEMLPAAALPVTSSTPVVEMLPADRLAVTVTSLGRPKVT